MDATCRAESRQRAVSLFGSRAMGSQCPFSGGSVYGHVNRRRRGRL